MPTNPPESSMLQAFKAARRVSTPLVAIETPDPGATIAAVCQVLNPKSPTLQWDIVRGLRGMNKLGTEVMAKLQVDPNMTVNPVTALEAIERVPESTAVFFHNMHRHLAAIEVVQGLWNIRDLFKLDRRTVVLLGSSFQLPAEIAGDVIVLVEPLPTRQELSVVLDQQYQNASLALPDDTTRQQALDAVVGLPAYTTEQVVALSLTPKGVDIDKLWDRKIQAIENNDGLHVWKDPSPLRLEDLKGIENAVAFVRELMEAEAFAAIAFIDEGDKAFAGGMSDYSGDSGVAKDQVGTILSYMVDTGALGVMLAGVAGTGKTELAKALAATSKKPLILFDLGGMKGGVVGQSERAIRQNLKVISATAEGRVLFLMTANKTTHFTPELNRRFPDQFFFDTPSDAAREAIWPVYITRCKLTPTQAAHDSGFDAGWTGAEIRRACERAALFGCTVEKAARWIIPQSVSAASVIDQLRREAAGRFLSASHAGWYQPPAVPDLMWTPKPQRSISMEES